MSRTKEIGPTVTSFYHSMHGEPNHRYLSWEHCYQRFQKALSERKPDTDRLALDVAFYLASWGMYRGSGFLLQKDYRIHLPIVEELLKPEWRAFNNRKRLMSGDGPSIIDLADRVGSHYAAIEKVNGKKVDVEASTILQTKILMGTLGCVPAFDRYFNAGLKRAGLGGNFNRKTLINLDAFLDGHEAEFIKLQATVKTTEGKPYPLMKLMDMYFWKLGGGGE